MLVSFSCDLLRTVMSPICCVWNTPPFRRHTQALMLNVDCAIGKARDKNRGQHNVICSQLECAICAHVSAAHLRHITFPCTYLTTYTFIKQSCPLPFPFTMSAFRKVFRSRKDSASESQSSSLPEHSLNYSEPLPHRPQSDINYSRPLPSDFTTPRPKNPINRSVSSFDIPATAPATEAWSPLEFCPDPSLHRDSHIPRTESPIQYRTFPPLTQACATLRSTRYCLLQSLQL